ncbi:uncharacterized protein METZ01_LOCUS255433 [marine metagenome]|uniref:Bacterial sugar transferase domain-containing protein n=1 Tax=marine metagenome TaxID=408172 RepID=A0A382ITI2_9ZZZZ
MKRFLDIILSTTAILILSPFLIPIILILKFTGERYIFYKQERIGQNDTPFNLLKFATMFKDSPNMEGGNITAKSDPRILPFGKFLRKYKINELPQIINVFFGDMSVVGRRPTVREHYDFYTQDIKNVISEYKPGLSGIASIVFRNEEQYFFSKDPAANKNFYEEEIAPYKGTLELWYCTNQSIIVDILLIIATISAVFVQSSKLHNYFFRDLPKHPLFNPK